MAAKGMHRLEFHVAGIFHFKQAANCSCPLPLPLPGLAALLLRFGFNPWSFLAALLSLLQCSLSCSLFLVGFFFYYLIALFWLPQRARRFFITFASSCSWQHRGLVRHVWLTQISLLRLRHLYECWVLFVVQYLYTLHVAVYTCELRNVLRLLI